MIILPLQCVSNECNVCQSIITHVHNGYNVVFLFFLYAIVCILTIEFFQLHRRFGLTVGIISQQKKILRNSCHSLWRIMWILQM